MTKYKNIKNSDEVDLASLLIIIFDNKLKIFFIPVLTTLIMYGYLLTQPSSIALYKVRTEISPPTTFDILKYSTYNSYIAKESISDFRFSQNSNYNISSQSSSNLPMTKIDKLFLLDLFIETIIQDLYIEQSYQKSFFSSGIKNFKLINRDNYKDKTSYENAIINLISSVKLRPAGGDNQNWYIEFIVEDGKNVIKFLKYLEKNINYKIQTDLEESFKSQILSQKKLKNFEIEDVQIEISNILENQIIEPGKDNNKNDQEILKIINILKLKEKSLLLNKKIMERFESIIFDTPITDPKKFIASKIITNQTKLKTITSSKISTAARLITTGLLTLILVFIYVILSRNMIRQKKA